MNNGAGASEGLKEMKERRTDVGRLACYEWGSYSFYKRRFSIPQGWGKWSWVSTQ